MKKVISFLLFSLIAASIFAQTPAPVLFTSRGITQKFGVFSEPSKPLTEKNNAIIGMEEQVQNAWQWINHNYTDSSQKFYVVGHSWGGLRAVGLANNPRVKGVVTVGSPIKGFTPLAAPGLNTMKNRLASIAKTIGVGYADLAQYKNGWGWLPISGGAAAAVTYDGIRTVLGAEDRHVLALMYLLDVGGIKTSTSENPLASAILLGTANPSIRDLTPGSDYLKARVSNVTPEKGRYGQVCVGFKDTYQWTWQWNWWGPSVHIRMVQVPIYKTIWIVESPEKIYSAVPKETFVLNIRGTDNNPLSLQTDLVARAEFVKQQNILKSELGSAMDYYGSCRSWSTAAAIGFWAIAWWQPWAVYPATVATAAAIGYGNQESNCNKAFQYVADPGKIVAEVYGHRNHDGFIPVEDQYDLNMGGTPAYFNNGSAFKNRVVDVVSSHLYEESDPQIWGPGGSLGSWSPNPADQGKVTGGEIKKFLIAAEGKDNFPKMETGGSVNSRRSF